MPSKRIAIFRHRPERQHGSALLVMMLILIVSLAAVLIHSLTSSAINSARQQKTAAALAQAKEALIGYAVTYGDTHSSQVHGYLPCPDFGGGNPEGSAEPVCGTQNANTIGRLPWATLDLSTLRDGDGECLWYAVSGTYKNNPKTGLMNWDTNGKFQVNAPDGTLLASQVVAVIFAPGAALSGQDRSGTAAPVCGGNYTAASYLDTGSINSINFNNADYVTGNFIQGTSGGNINDQMVFITRQDIWNAIQKRSDFQPTNPNNPLIMMTQQVALCLAKYSHNNSNNFNYSLPWPAPLALSDYSVNADYQDSPTILFAGRVPYSVSYSNSTTHNSLGNLMTAASCGSGWTSSVDIWWNNWKDHLFYAIGKNYRPTTNLYQSCGFCLRVNGSGQIAAVIMFANNRLAGQTRASDTTGVTSAPRGTVSNYLEDVSPGVGNASNFPDTTNGTKNYISGSASSTFNDVLYCIDSNLNVGPC